jgi:autotransporter-associated beta strand protein
MKLRSRSFALVASFVALVCCAVAPVANAQQKPNIILLVADDAGYADFGFQNQFTGATTQFKTPNLDALAGQSRVMSNGYVAAAVCSVSRAGFLTGRNPQRFGFEYNVTTDGSVNDGMPTSEVMMMEALKEAGYKTGAFGKWHIGSSIDRQPQNQGVDEFFGVLAGGRPYFATGGVPVLRNGAPVQWQNETSFNNIAPDPVLGRHFTDALGDEASKFVATNANQANPFFMYVPFTAPHSPYDLAKEQDIAQFAGTTMTEIQKKVAASQLAMDRAVGNIMARVNDPNGDGSTSDSIANNTIIAFISDNGGEQPYSASNNETVHNNSPLFRWKGTQWEGGIRVPMIVKMPGGTPGVFNQPVSSLDFMPTFLAAAGVTRPDNLDGEDLAPFLDGTQTGAVHDALYWRQGPSGGWAMRQGDWKLVHGSETAGFPLYKLNANGSGEAPGSTNYATSQPAIYRSMINQFVDWEATLDKPRWTTSRALNRFDAFRFRQDAPTTANWRDSVWVQDDAPSMQAVMNREDSYANAVLVFQPRNDADYAANNNISRAVGLYYGHIDSGGKNPDGLAEYMLNELRFDGQFGGAANRSGTLTGFPLMFVKSLAGAGARMRLDNSSTVANKFAFNVNMDVVLHDPLEITGNSDQTFAINGQIRDFDEPMSLTKSGTSVITLGGNNTYAGATIVNGGTLRIDGANAALANTSHVQIGAQGTVALASGRVHSVLMQINSGGAFQFTGGILETAQVVGDLANNGGSFRPGLSLAQTTITGDFTQTAGTTVIELGGNTPGTQFDQVFAGDDVSLGGALQVSLVNLGGGTFSPALGSAFEIIRAGDALAGTFGSVSVPALTAGRKWAIQYSGKNVSLQVVAGLSADFDQNNVVNAADLNVWRTSLGASAQGDADLDGDTDASDFIAWQRQVGSQLLTGVATAAAGAIPEPNSALLFTAAALALGGLRRKAFRRGC